jgi:hypothetical protein
MWLENVLSAAHAEANWRHPSMIANEPGRAF